MMLEKMKDLVRTKDVCVLATVSEGQPHCSLMSYATDKDCREIYMVTPKKTKKYQNLTGNPAVSLLIDTRDEDRGNNRHRAKALTVNGRFEAIRDPGKKNLIKASLLERHPHLNVLVDDPDVEFFAVRIKSLQLLEGVADATFETVA
jgi:nitroimidazol reductase NimA-like FMN-containing flavoprotein (pyridoxamine 5'-phosphate oxidase superfamily)